jgi:uncharacterized membrane protein
MKLPRVYTFGTISRAFLTGLAFLAPLLLTAIVLSWVMSQLIGFVGPDSVVGHVLTAGGRLFAGDRVHPLFSFAVGVLLVLGFVTALGFLLQDRVKKVLEETVDKALGRIPLLGNVYRPVAQMVRSMGGSRAEEMQAMAVCRVEFGGGVETIAFLASAESFDIGGGPARLVLIPTAPVPIGGALLLVAAHKVHVIPDMKFDDIARLYLTMGMTPPPNLRPAP